MPRIKQAVTLMAIAASAAVAPAGAAPPEPDGAAAAYYWEMIRPPVPRGADERRPLATEEEALAYGRRVIEATEARSPGGQPKLAQGPYTVEDRVDAWWVSAGVPAAPGWGSPIGVELRKRDAKVLFYGATIPGMGRAPSPHDAPPPSETFMLENIRGVAERTPLRTADEARAYGERAIRASEGSIAFTKQAPYLVEDHGDTWRIIGSRSLWERQTPVLIELRKTDAMPTNYGTCFLPHTAPSPNELEEGRRDVEYVSGAEHRTPLPTADAAQAYATAILRATEHDGDWIDVTVADQGDAWLVSATLIVDPERRMQRHIGLRKADAAVIMYGRWQLDP